MIDIESIADYLGVLSAPILNYKITISLEKKNTVQNKSTWW